MQIYNKIYRIPLNFKQSHPLLKHKKSIPMYQKLFYIVNLLIKINLAHYSNF